MNLRALQKPSIRVGTAHHLPWPLQPYSHIGRIVEAPRDTDDLVLQSLPASYKLFFILLLPSDKDRSHLPLSEGRKLEGRCGRGPRRLGPGWQTPLRLHDQSDTEAASLWKTKLVQLSLTTAEPVNDKVMVKNEILDIVDTTSFLDFTLDAKLRWSSHITRLVF
ncbi:hypothetical protein EVAR_94563_1 [Eumeta japonica]|uniref:Uncharacterized protein n=1 Tax=Eumeta variegata TaxID=151549 RepID=A0A4C1UUS6_EUMVA|nr:hypothetical protein EVAR_94563_1 [Eumeta japonica]